MGDTFPVGAKLSNNYVFYNKHYHINNSSLNIDIYEDNCGFNNVDFSWGHDEYIASTNANNSSVSVIDIFRTRCTHSTRFNKHKINSQLEVTSPESPHETKNMPHLHHSKKLLLELAFERAITVLFNQSMNGQIDTFYIMVFERKDISDIKNNRTQFTEFLKKENSASVIIVYKGEEMQLMDFIMQIRTTERNDGAIFLQSLRLNESNVFYNSEKTKIIKLKITK